MDANVDQSIRLPIPKMASLLSGCNTIRKSNVIRWIDNQLKKC
jgi:hypothetical protein